MKKVSLLLNVAVMAALMITSCGGSSSKEVKIGNQVWMAENLNIEKFRNGDPIPEAKTDEEWVAAGNNKQPAWCYYKNNSDLGERNGKLYNWYAVNDPRGLAPAGWKIPSNDDWSRLIDFLGGEAVAGKKMKSIDFWADNEGESGNGNNESGFNGLPVGVRLDGGRFKYVGEYCSWWRSEEYSTGNAFYRYLIYTNSNVDKGHDSKATGLSVRCVRE